MNLKTKIYRKGLTMRTKPLIELVRQHVADLSAAEEAEREAGQQVDQILQKMKPDAQKLADRIAKYLDDLDTVLVHVDHVSTVSPDRGMGSINAAGRIQWGGFWYADGQPADPGDHVRLTDALYTLFNGMNFVYPVVFRDGKYGARLRGPGEALGLPFLSFDFSAAPEQTRRVIKQLQGQSDAMQKRIPVVGGMIETLLEHMPEDTE